MLHRIREHFQSADIEGHLAQNHFCFELNPLMTAAAHFS
jgi:hypothetical protein